MSQNSRVPVSLTLLQPYLINTDNRQLATNPVTGNAYYIDFGWTPAESAAWTADRTQYVGTLFPNFSNPNRTADASSLATKFRDAFAGRAEQPLNKIVSSGMGSPTDALIFHVVLEHHDPTYHTTPIADPCFAKLVSAGAGAFDVHCNVLASFGHSHIPVAHGANSIQYAYRIFEQSQAGPFDPNDASFVKEISTRAHFTINVGAANQGKWVVIYFRWYNTKHLNLAPAWTGVLYSMPIG